MDQQQVISELTQELDRDHIGGRAGRIVELVIGLFLLAGGTLRLAVEQGICGSIRPSGDGGGDVLTVLLRR